MMNAMLFCEECGAANSGQLPYCFACHKPLTLPTSSPSTSDVSATFTQVPVGNGKIAYQLAEPEEITQPSRLIGLYMLGTMLILTLIMLMIGLFGLL